MANTNSRNLLYFEAASMRLLHDAMDSWQVANGKRLLSLSIHQDNGQYCCIALTNPTEVVVVDGSKEFGASVEPGGYLKVAAFMAR